MEKDRCKINQTKKKTGSYFHISTIYLNLQVFVQTALTKHYSYRMKAKTSN